MLTSSRWKSRLFLIAARDVITTTRITMEMMIEIMITMLVAPYGIHWIFTPEFITCSILRTEVIRSLPMDLRLQERSARSGLLLVIKIQSSSTAYPIRLLYGMVITT